MKNNDSSVHHKTATYTISTGYGTGLAADQGQNGTEVLQVAAALRAWARGKPVPIAERARAIAINLKTCARANRLDDPGFRRMMAACVEDLALLM